MLNRFNKLLVVVGALIVVGAVSFAVKSTQDAKKLQQQIESLQQTQQEASPEEAKKFVEEVSRLIVLPEGEDPTIATITDKEKLKDVPFFAKAENGDRVLIYVNARKAFLYRPDAQRIIEVATLNLNTADQEFTGKIVLRNGTETAGLTKRFEEVLKEGLPQVEVVGRDNAKRTTYTNILVVDLTGSRKEDAERLANTLSGEVVDLPADEPKPEGADFLIIIGSEVVEAASATPAPQAPAPQPSPPPAE
jgi:hypothetical protein